MANKTLFGRVCRLRIKTDAGELIIIDGFDMSFEIEKTREVQPNKAKFQIFNLPERIRNKMQLTDKDKIEFEAGYKLTASRVFIGDATHALSGTQGPDWVTTIEAQEGIKAYRSSYVAKSYGPGTPYKTIIEDVVKSFGVYKVTPQITKIISSLGKAAPNGLTVDGPSAKVLNDVLGGLGLAYSIQNDQIQILATSVGTSDLPAVKLGYDSGLVGIPQLGEKTEKATLSFQSLLQPELVPGRKVLLTTQGVKGTFVCDNVKHKGDNFGKEFYSHCQAFL